MPKVTSPDPSKRGAFSLLELLIVIVLLSLMAMLLFGTMQQKAPRPKALDLAHLKSLEKTISPQGMELLCIESGSQCFLRDLESRKMKLIDFAPGPLRVYLLDHRKEVKRVEFGRYKDHKITLRFHFNPNGSTSTMLIESKDRFYFIPSYFGEIKPFPTLPSALEYAQKSLFPLQREGEYY